MTVDIRLYGPNDVATIPWSYDYVNSSERIWMEAFLNGGTQVHIQNVSTQFYILQLNQWFFPVTVNETEYDNAYVCSPYTHYISYARQELRHLKAPFLEKALAILLTLLGFCFKASQINKTVHVNNWLLSTNLYPNWQCEYLHELTEWLIKKFPNHTLIFRSLNDRTEQIKLQSFQNKGYRLLPSRQVYFINGQNSTFLKKKDVKNDAALFRKTPYKIVPHESLTHEDIPRIVSLYNELYLDKYSCHNPQFTETFMSFCLQNKLLTMHGLRGSDGSLDGIIGYFERNGVMTTPLVGYNRSCPQADGLYRLLTLQVLQIADKTKLLFNMSSGAASFKRSRGAEAALEYSAVFDRHVPLLRQFPWWILDKLTNKVAKPLMQKFKL